MVNKKLILIVGLITLLFAITSCGIIPPQEPEVPDEPVVCCLAMVAECFACEAGISIEEYCENNPNVDGCEPYAPLEPDEPDEPIGCCLAMTAECLACQAGVSVEEYCVDNPSVVGCEPYSPTEPEEPDEPIGCCLAMTAECLACQAGISIEEYCTDNPNVDGCETHLPDEEHEGRSLYVDANNGNDNNDGTQQNPYKTVRHAVDNAKSRDTILLMTGNYGDVVLGVTGQHTWQHRRIPVLFNDWVTIKPAPGQKPEFNSLHVGTLNRDEGGDLLFSTKGHIEAYLRFDGIKVNDGIKFHGTNYLEFINGEVRRNAEWPQIIRHTGIQILNGRYILLENNLVTNTGHGIQIMAYDVTARGNNIYKVSEDAFSITGGDNIILENNIIHFVDDGISDDETDPVLKDYNRHADGIHIYTVGWKDSKYAEDLGTFIVRGNLFYNVESMMFMLGWNAVDGKNNRWQGPFIFENNIFGPSGGILFHLGAHVHEGVIFRHNTILHAPNNVWESHHGRKMSGQAYTFALWGHAQDQTKYEFYNNIFASEINIPQEFGFVTHNIHRGNRNEEINRNQYVREMVPYVPVTGTITKWIEEGNLENMLPENSFAINKGSTHNPIGFDYHNNPRTEIPDIGAVEFQKD